jgi:2-dehydro-3-deoxyphosphogluconate aldolase/(4S)-4-hydroxy-2-oxoglutarate aldolase
MSRLTRSHVNQQIEEHAFIPLFNPSDAKLTKSVLQAAYAGGVRVFELTNRSDNALSIFKEIIPFVQQNLPELIIGAGTIMDEESAKAFYEAGAAFVISPILSKEVASYCEKNKICWIPGAATLTEIVNAHKLGADIVKIFPANYLGGPGFVEAIKAPCPWLRLMPTGGVDRSEENLRAWFKAGVRCVGIGSQLFRKELLANNDFSTLEQDTRQVVEIIRKIKSAK